MVCRGWLRSRRGIDTTIFSFVEILVGIEQKGICGSNSFRISNGSRSGLKHVLISKRNRFSAGGRSVRVARSTTVVVIVAVGRGAWLVIGSVGIEETLTPVMATVQWTSVVVSHFDVLFVIVGLFGLGASGLIASIGIMFVGDVLRVVPVVVVVAVVVAPIGVVGGISAVVHDVGTGTHSWLAWIQHLEQEKISTEAFEGFCAQCALHFAKLVTEQLGHGLKQQEGEFTIGEAFVVFILSWQFVG